jgi:KDO2-lipid IV(A) lauroyltransferase
MNEMKLSSFLQMRSNLFVFQMLGWRIAFYYILILGRLYFFVRRDEKKKIEASIRSVFGPSKDKREMMCLTKDVFRGIMAHYYEKLFNAYEDMGKLINFFHNHIEAPGLGMLDAALARRQGVLFVTGHYGGIEYIPIYLATKGYSISVVAKFATTRLKAALVRRTEPLGLKIIDAGKKDGLLRSVLGDLKANRIVFVECDEIKEWRPSERERILFLGKWVALDRTINVLQRRTQSEVIFGVLHRFSLKKYTLELENFPGIKYYFKYRIVSVAEAVLRRFEKCIYAHPEGWYQWDNYPDFINRFGAVSSRRFLENGKLDRREAVRFGLIGFPSRVAREPHR